MNFLSRIRNVLTGVALATCLGAPVHAAETESQMSTAAAAARWDIANTAQMTFGSGADARTVSSNTVTLSGVSKIPPVIRFMRMAGASPSVTMDTSAGQCQMGAGGPWVPMISDDEPPFDAAAVPLADATHYEAGDPVFIQVLAPDSNTDATVRDTITITVKTDAGDAETLNIRETGVNTGVFMGFINSDEDYAPKADNCLLSLFRGGKITAGFNDAINAPVSDSALVDPFGFVFSTDTALPVTGAAVTLIDDATGQPAKVYGTDGISDYPSTVVSGQNVTDASGKVYYALPGEFRFPLIAPGHYHLETVPPQGYTAPTTVPLATLQALVTPIGTPFVLPPASFGESFTVSASDDDIQIDVPIDPVGGGHGHTPVVRKVNSLTLTKAASVSSGSLGDFVQYRVTIRNSSGLAYVAAVWVKDVLPVGFRYVPGTARRAGVKVADPTVGADGRTLSFNLGSIVGASTGDLTYVTAIGPEAAVGDAVNQVSATGASGAGSNTAEAHVQVEAPLQMDVATLVGRIAETACAPNETPRTGVAGVRVLMEDGTFVVSDKDGLFHFEGVHPGVHVVQLDVDSIPAGYEAVVCGGDTRTAGRAFSQFIDVKAGGLWRVEFRLRRLAGAAAPTPAADADAAAADVPAANEDDFPKDLFAGQDAGIDWVFPGVALNPRAPTLRVAIKHAPRQTVALTLNGQPVDVLTRDGEETSADGQIAVSLWRGLPLAEGANTLVARVSNGAGQVVETLTRTVSYANTPAHAALVAAASRLSADGLASPVIAVRFTDRFGHPVRAGAIGTFEVAAPYAPALDVADLQGRQFTGQERAANSWRVTGNDGVALIRLAPTTTAGPALLKFVMPGAGAARPEEVRAWLQADRQKWIVVGFGAGTVGFNTLSQNVSALDRADGGKVFKDGQLSFYAKGRIKGSWLLTMAYNNKKPVDNSRGLFSAIDPNRYYSVYGDGTGQAYDASSQRKLYLRLERRAFYALFGDYQAGFDATELGRYTRALNGVKVERQGRTITFSAFAAQTDQLHMRDELPGSGLSGRYQLTHHNITPNTDIITIETRDRLRSERILSTRALVRDVDYQIDYVTGGLNFADPVLSRDVDGNPNVIVAAYDVLGGGDKALEAGARATVTFAGGKATAGVTYLHGRTRAATGEGDVVAADLVVRPRADTTIHLEAATSRAQGADAQTAYLAQVDHHSKDVDLSAYVRQQDQNYGLGQQNIADLGARKMGADGKIRLGDHFTLTGSGYHETYLLSGAQRDVLDARLDYTLGVLRLNAGLKSVHDTTGATSSVSNLLTLGASRDFLNKRLQVTVSSDFALGKADSVDFPVRRRVGVSYQVSEHIRLLASHEISEGNGYTSAITSAGAEITPWKGAHLTSAVAEQQLSAFGPRTTAQVGLTQTLALGKAWTVDASIDANHTLSGAPTADYALNPATAAVIKEDFTSVSIGGAYRAEMWTWNGRAEVRRGDLMDSWNVRSNYLRRLTAGVTAALTVRADETTSAKGAVAGSAEVAGSIAWRPLDGQWSLLEKLSYRRDSATGTAAGQDLAGFGALAVSDGVSSRVVNNLAVNFDSARGDHGAGALQVSAFYGAKFVQGHFSGDEVSGFVQAIGIEARYDVTERIDIGLNLNIRHAATGGQLAYAAGVSVGVSPAENTWISVGWNLVGYTDHDFDGAGYTRQGPYVTARLKFDQLSLAPLTHMFDRNGK